MLYAYLIANGFLYSFIFWQGFNINILQYVSPYDLLPSILFLLILPLLFVVFYFGLIALIIPFNERLDRIFNKKQSKTYRIVKIALSLIIRTSAILYTLYLVFFNTGLDRQMGVLFIVAFIVLKLTYKKITLFSDKGNMRDVYLGAVIILPLIIYMIAFYRVDGIKKGIHSYIVTSDSDCTKAEGDSFRYISSIGDKAFAYSLSDNSLCVFKYNYLHLKDEEKVRQHNIREFQPNAI